DVYGSATTPVAQGAALSSVAARAEAMAYAMRASESNGSIESCRLTKETARQALMDARDRYNGLKQRIPNLRTSRIIRSTRAMIEESCRLLGHRQSHATLRKELEEAEQALLCHECMLHANSLSSISSSAIISTRAKPNFCWKILSTVSLRSKHTLTGLDRN